MPARELPGWWRRFSGDGAPPPAHGDHPFEPGPSGAIYV
jgi:hypothetical protein